MSSSLMTDNARFLAILLLVLPSLAAAKTLKKQAPKGGLDCANAQAIRDFKDAVYLNGHYDNGQMKWARCLCPKTADKAGFNKSRPPMPNAVPSFPRYAPRDLDGTRLKFAKWFKTYLPVSVDQAAALAICEVPLKPSLTSALK